MNGYRGIAAFQPDGVRSVCRLSFALLIISGTIGLSDEATAGEPTIWRGKLSGECHFNNKALRDGNVFEARSEGGRLYLIADGKPFLEASIRRDGTFTGVIQSRWSSMKLTGTVTADQIDARLLHQSCSGTMRLARVEGSGAQVAAAPAPAKGDRAPGPKGDRAKLKANPKRAKGGTTVFSAKPRNQTVARSDARLNRRQTKEILFDQIGLKLSDLNSQSDEATRTEQAFWTNKDSRESVSIFVSLLNPGYVRRYEYTLEHMKEHSAYAGKMSFAPTEKELIGGQLYHYALAKANRHNCIVFTHNFGDPGGGQNSADKRPHFIGGHYCTPESIGPDRIRTLLQSLGVRQYFDPQDAFIGGGPTANP